MILDDQTPPSDKDQRSGSDVPLDEVRQAAKQVTDQARHVQIQYDRIQEYALGLTGESLTTLPPRDPRDSPAVGPADLAAYVVTLDAINFGSGYFPHLKKKASFSGYFTIASALRKRFDREGAFNGDELEGMTSERCAALFEQSLDDPVMHELMSAFATALRELGAFINDRPGGFVGIVERAGGSVQAIVSELLAMPAYQDVAEYHDIRVPFLKRAQITVADLAVQFEGRSLGKFNDLGTLTIFADNAVPNVLRVDGVLEYSPELATTIATGTLIPSGSDEEIELRASAVHAVELVVEALKQMGVDTCSMLVDQFLWRRGQGALYKASPRHRTRTIYY